MMVVNLVGGIMKVVMTLLVRDEEDIIEQNIQYHLNNGVDFIVVTDNLSVDGTTDILHKYEREGVLHYIHEPNDDYNQTAWVTRMTKLSVEQFRADWIIHSDADEFWWPESGDIKAVLQTVPQKVPVINARRYNFPPVGMETTTNPLEVMVYRQSVARDEIGRSQLPKICHRPLRGIIITQGNHEIYTELTKAKIKSIPLDTMCVFHFPLRNLKQYANKIVKGGAAYRRSSQPKTQGITWRRMYLKYKKNKSRLTKFFRKQTLTNARITRYLESKSIKEDRRLLEFLRAKDILPKNTV